MKKIYIVDEHQSSKQNGVGTYIRNLLNCFEHSEHEVNLVSFNADEKEFMIDKPAYYTEYHIPVCAKGDFLSNGALSLPILRLYIDDSEDNVFFVSHSPCLKFLKTLQSLFPKSERIFVIHDQGWTSKLLGNKEELYRIMNTRRLPSTPKDLKDKYSYIRKYIHEEQGIYKHVHRVICLCQGTKELLLDLYQVPEHKVTVIPNGIQPIERHLTELEKYQTRERLGISPDEIVLLYAGRISEAKGTFALLKAFEKLWHENHHLRLIIAGQVFNLNDAIKYTPNSCTHVTYIGLVEKDRLNEWYEIADIGILPSNSEQCSYTGIEMLAHGKTIVATDGHNLSDMFNTEVAFITHIPTNRNTDSFANELSFQLSKALSLTANQQNKIQTYTQDLFIRKYCIESFIKSYKSLFEES